MEKTEYTNPKPTILIEVKRKTSAKSFAKKKNRLQWDKIRLSWTKRQLLFSLGKQPCGALNAQKYSTI